MSSLKQDSLDYHAHGRPGKLKITATKPMDTQRDLSLAYSPGVAYPVLAIADDPELAYDYTAKGNLVAVISNGTAILGLGDRGPLASKPVMEGKAVLFKRFADVDVFDIEVNSKSIPPLAASTWKISRRPNASISSVSCRSAWTSPSSMTTSTARPSSRARV